MPEARPDTTTSLDFARIRACAWPPLPPPDAARVRMIFPEEPDAWTVYEDDELWVLNKPGDVVCHPSKAGPWSSLVGAVKAARQLEKAHLIFRLDRETSGLVIFAKNAALASKLQKAVQNHQIGKTYLAILVGKLEQARQVDQPLGDDSSSPVYIKSRVRSDGKPAQTEFIPLASTDEYTLCRMHPLTGRKHQIRLHAQWLGHSVLGDKLYGPDPLCYLEFIEHGWTDALAKKLIHPRQALHCAGIDLRPSGLPYSFTAPLAADLARFCQTHGLHPEDAPSTPAPRA